MKLSRFWAVTQILFIGLLCAFSAQARQTVFAWDAVPSWPAGTTVELEANGASANGITTTQYTIDVPVQPGEVISFRVRAIPPAGYECGDPLSLCPPSDWAALSRTLPAAPTGLWANKELIGGGVMADPVFGGYGTVVNTGSSSASTLTSTITNVESGDLVIALVQRNYSATNLTGITCDGNAMTVVSTVNSGVNNFAFYLYTYRATSAISSAAVVASFSDSQAWGSMITARWSNVSSATALGFQRSPSSGSGLTGPATTRTVPTALTTSERALIIAVGTDWDNYNTHTAANSFTKRFDNAIAGGGSSSVQFIYSRVANAGSFGAGSNFGTAASDQYLAILAAFPITAGGAATISPNN